MASANRKMNNLKHKILFFASGYKYSGSANGVCARNLVREFIRQGHEVFVIAVPHDNEVGMEFVDGARVWFVEDELQTRVLFYLQQHGTNTFMRFVHKAYSLARALLVAAVYPNVARIRVHKMLRLSHQIIREYGIDTVIGTCLPYDGVAAAMALKKSYGGRLRVVTYHFDILSTPNNGMGAIYRFKKRRFAEAFEKELRIVDKVYLPETAMELHKDKTNVEFIGLPTYVSTVNDGDECPYSFHDDVYNIVYIGSLDIRNRSVKPAVDWLKRVNQVSEKKYRLHIWGALADAETNKIIEDNSSLVEYHGMLENSKVRAVMKHADLLLNVSNLLLYKLLPSKIFTMFSTGKPIVNIVNNANDCALPYFEKYGNVVSVNAQGTGSEDGNPVHLIGKKVDADELFTNYMPSTISKILLKDD